ncbi:hypothetical protein H0G86_000241 [Trichoderma simmonsii]|uniref:Uncharacterized protein n=1 Tax=Trichoderma simmonsii TaxID=1491479 RepID=A0A8G0P829_9HYPO|nr:hypothetical protein H0G86_000241 [Trichoderma simmonsii]
MSSENQVWGFHLWNGWDEGSNLEIGILGRISPPPVNNNSSSRPASAQNMTIEPDLEPSVDEETMEPNLAPPVDEETMEPNLAPPVDEETSEHRSEHGSERPIETETSEHRSEHRSEPPVETELVQRNSETPIPKASPSWKKRVGRYIYHGLMCGAAITTIATGVHYFITKK